MPAEMLPDPCLDHIDWINVWRERKIRQLSTPFYRNSLEFWSDKENVQRLYSSNSNGRNQLAREQIKGMTIQPGARVLDIGAGPGTLSVPLAKIGCKVTAVEPSDAMCEAFEAYRMRERIKKIRIIRKRWEDIPAEELEGPFDTVIASFSLSMTEIGESLQKMNEVCNGSVYLFWFMTPLPSSRAMHDLWPKVHGVPYYYEPMADCLYMVLIQSGIYPNIEVTASSHAHRYATIGDAVEDFHRRMACETDQQDNLIRQYMRTHLCGSGSEFQLRGTSLGAKIWWSREG
jgi:ubiquinone/menaquinone biosynthesis C-methylase UbiE